MGSSSELSASDIYAPKTSGLMDLCPTEILLKIFILACTDGGRTGCSLSLVSHAIRAISSTVRFHSVALHDLSRMRRFQKLFDDEYKSHPPTVHHLFLCDDGYEAQSRCGEKPLDVVTSIITTVAPSLITVAGDLWYIRATYTSLLPPRAHFPHLRDISLNVIEGVSDFPKSSSLPPLPDLHQLHIWGLIRGAEDVEHLSHFTAVAPKLFKIRLSDMLEAHDLPRILKAALKENVAYLASRTAQERRNDEDESAQLWKEERPEIKLPQHLQQLFLQPLSIPSERWIGMPGMDPHAVMMSNLFELAIKYDKVGVVSLLPPNRYMMEDCLKDWLEVISGGDGCWRTEDDF